MPGEAVAGKPEKQDPDTNKALLPGGGVGPPPWSEQKFAIATAGGGGGGAKWGTLMEKKIASSTPQENFPRLQKKGVPRHVK